MKNVDTQPLLDMQGLLNILKEQWQRVMSCTTGELIIISHLVFIIHFLLYVLGMGHNGQDTSEMFSGLFSLWTFESIYRRGCYFLLSAYMASAYEGKMVSGLSDLLKPTVSQNLRYALISLFLVISKPFLLLYSIMFVYSVYALLGSKFLGDLGKLEIVSKVINSQSTAYMLCSYAEIAVLPALFARMMMGNGSLLYVAAYIHFLRIQYSSLTRMRRAFSEIDLGLMELTKNASCPPAARYAYQKMRPILSQMAPEVSQN